MSSAYRDMRISRLNSVGTDKMNRFSSRATGSMSENQVEMVVSVMFCFRMESTLSQISAAEFMGILLFRQNVRSPVVFWILFPKMGRFCGELDKKSVYYIRFCPRLQDLGTIPGEGCLVGNEGIGPFWGQSAGGRGGEEQGCANCRSVKNQKAQDVASWRNRKNLG